MFYRTGRDFEEAVFGFRSNDNLFKRFGGRNADLADDVKAFIARSSVVYPDAPIGEALYSQMAIEFDRLGIDHEGLIFLPSVDTELDLGGIDGVVYHPRFFPRLVTVDAFNIRPRELSLLRETWIDSHEGRNQNGDIFFSREDEQSNLFLFKRGMANWKRINKEALEQEAQGKGFVIRPKDFRQLADRVGWENHLILTPRDTGTYEGRRLFAKLVAGYFAKVAKASSHKMALLSH
jgi:hypothetical protein